MRIALYGATFVAFLVLFSPETLRGALAASASALFEATPFLLASVIVARLLRRYDALTYLGCGCGSGPSARSLPAAAATYLLFGPLVAIARFAAAILVAAVLRRNEPCAPTRVDLLDELDALLAPALLAGVAVQFGSTIDPARLAPWAAAAAGALLGFVAAPCALGAVAIAGALHARAPLMATAFLSVAGIVDLRALRARAHAATSRDALAYLVLAVSLGFVALRKGGALVHPVLTPALAACAVAAFVLALKHRRRQAPIRRAAPILMLIGSLVAAPPPEYRATETTLTDLFPGESLSFTGSLTRDGGSAALVRYAITCCRADASPVVVRLDRAPPYVVGTWLRVDGRIETFNGDLRVVAERVDRIAPPSDPFVYR